MERFEEGAETRWADQRISRKGFLKALSTTFAAGVGLAILPDGAHASERRRSRSPDTIDCAVVCVPTSCSSHNGCGSGWQFHCTGCGLSYYQCATRTCATWCVQQGC
jgi:hypothetical protein